MDGLLQALRSALGAVPKARLMLVTDLDHTLVEHGEPSHARLLALNDAWRSRLAADSLLVYSTGRSPQLYAQLAAQAPMMTPHLLICSVGTEIRYATGGGPGGGAEGPEFRELAQWGEELDRGWDRAVAAAVVAQHCPQLQPQAPSEQRRHKLSYVLQAADAGGPQAADALLGRLRAQLAAAGLQAKVIYSGGQDVDVLPAGAGKGFALRFLLQQLAEGGAGLVSTSGTLVAGDSGNDIELFEVPGVRGCVVANAHPELRQWALQAGSDPRILQASQPCAGGILQALHHFGFLQGPPPGANATADKPQEGEEASSGAAHGRDGTQQQAVIN